MFTRCPTCQTTYKVHPEQLSAASGLVRCGQCDTVFQALDHLFEITHSPYPVATPAAVEGEEESAAAPAPQQEMEAPYQEAVEETTEEPTEEPAEEAFEEHLEEAAETVEMEAATEETEPYAEQASESIEQQESEYPTEETPESHEEAEEIPAESIEEFIEETPAVAEEREVSEEQPSTEELESTETPEPEISSEEKSLQADYDYDGGEEYDQIELDDFHEEETDEISIPAEEFVGPLPEARKEEELESAEQEAAEAPFTEPKQPSTSSTLIKAAAALLLITTLLLQLVYFNRIELAKQPELRPLLEQGCGLIAQYIPCDIPFQQDVSAFEIKEREIRSHASEKGVLAVNAIFTNNASFTQPYPLVTLSFHSLEGEVIAERSFEPRLYLPKNTNINKGMASGEKIHLTLNIVDPGPQAVNFLFDFALNP